jgi:hypothetical protein
MNNLEKKPMDERIALGQALDRFPPPAVIVFADDLLAVSRHTGRAMI